MFETMSSAVKVVEVGPRDGLQNEKTNVLTADKVRLIESLAQAGLKHIEITSFVSPKWIPQMADALEVAQKINLPKHVSVSALVPNLKGLESAAQAHLKEIAVFMSATETHSKKNINKSIEDALTTIIEVINKASEYKMKIRAYLSVVFVCPYEGKVLPDKVVPLVEKLIALGVDELSLGDTIGGATPKDVIALLTAMTKAGVDKNKIALHFHDTYGMALANVVAGLEYGITTFDSSIGGLGGCPYAPGAAGNLATEDLVFLLNQMGIKTGIDFDKLVDCGKLAQEIIGRKLPSRCLQAVLAQREKQLQLEEKNK
jgi:hydroxymethylglutaryl-CoA lyase